MTGPLGYGNERWIKASSLIDYNFAKYGSSAERKRLLEKWDKEVGGGAVTK